MSQIILSPKKVHHKRDTNVLELVWNNGEVVSISGDKIRQFCACASCRSRKVIGQQLITDSGKIEKVNLMGSTGMQIVFDDGHDRGIFPWAYLNAIAKGSALDYLEA